MEIKPFLLVFAVGFAVFQLAPVNTLLINNPYCAYYNASFLTNFTIYICHNYRSLPVNLSHAGDAYILKMNDKTNTLDTLQSGALRSTGLNNLQKLYLNWCRIRKIELGAFRGGRKLTLLGLNHNRIESLDLRVFEGLESLEFLGLEGNHLKSFGNQEFPRMPLRELYLGSCGLTEVKENLFINLPTLQNLHLQENLLKTLDWKVFSKFKVLITLLLQGNPWHCDCHIKFLLDYLDFDMVIWELPGLVPECTTAIPEGEKRLVGIKWLRINRELLVCPPKIETLHYSKDEMNSSRLQCQYSGYPEPSVTWKKDGEPLENPEVNKEYLDKENSTMFNFKQTVIAPSEANTDGDAMFECSMTSKAGTAEASIKVGAEDEEVYWNGIIPTVSTKRPSPPPGIRSFNQQQPKKANVGLIVGISIGVGVLLFAGGVALSYFIKQRRQPIPRPYHGIPKRESDRNGNVGIVMAGSSDEPRYYDNNI